MFSNSNVQYFIAYLLSVYQQWCQLYMQSCNRSLKSDMQQMTKSDLKCMIKFEIFTNETKLVEIYRKSLISQKNIFISWIKPHFTENVTTVRS